MITKKQLFTEKPTCKTCVYWCNEGACRRYAPRWQYRGNHQYNTVEDEPRIDHNYWCGEHPDFEKWREQQKEKEF